MNEQIIRLHPLRTVVIVGCQKIKTYLIPFCQPSAGSKSSGRSCHKPLGTNMAAPFSVVAHPMQTLKRLDFHKMKPHRACSTSHHAGTPVMHQDASAKRSQDTAVTFDTVRTCWEYEKVLSGDFLAFIYLLRD